MADRDSDNRRGKPPHRGERGQPFAGKRSGGGKRFDGGKSAGENKSAGGGKSFAGGGKSFGGRKSFGSGGKFSGGGKSSGGGRFSGGSRFHGGDKASSDDKSFGGEKPFEGAESFGDNTRSAKDKRFGGGKRFPGKPRAGPWRSPPRDRDGPVVLYGWHSVTAALANPQRRFIRLLATENAARRLTDDGIKHDVQLDMVRPDDIEALVGPEAVHQGLYAEADPLPSPELEDVASGVLLVLDQITDPHNVGAILRSAAAFAVTAVVTTARHTPEATGVLAKAASGALEYVPIVTVGNLSQALRTLKDHHTLLVGLDSSGEADLAGVAFSAPVALVLGAEGKGLRHLTRSLCDVVARLDLPGQIKSLNVSNATALALYVATTRLAAQG